MAKARVKAVLCSKTPVSRESGSWQCHQELVGADSLEVHKLEGHATSSPEQKSAMCLYYTIPYHTIPYHTILYYTRLD